MYSSVIDQVTYPVLEKAIHSILLKGYCCSLSDGLKNDHGKPCCCQDKNYKRVTYVPMT